MMQRNWWDQYEQVAPEAPAAPASPQARPPGYIPGMPAQPTPLELNRDRRDEQDQLLQQKRFDRMTEIELIKLRRQQEIDRRANVAASRLPGDKEKSLQEIVSTVSSLGRSLAGFNPDYLGAGAGIENTSQAYLGIGTPGQRDWWADFRSTDNIVRNQLFGASLTAPEKAAFAQTTITPDMTPEQARVNIERRRDIARSGLQRYRTYLVRSGYGADAIDALIGDALADATTASPVAPGGAGPIGPERNSLTIDSVADFAAGLSGGKYDLAPDGGLTYDGKPVEVSDDIANSPQYREAYLAKFGKVPPVQVSVEGGEGGDPSLLDAELDKAGRRDDIADPFIRGVADVPTMGGSDEIAAAAQTIFGDGTMRENLQRERGITAYDERYNPVPRMAGQVAGSFLLPVPASATTASRLAGVGAGYGAAYGFGSADGSLTDRLAGAASGGLTGAATGFIGGSIAQALAGRGGPGGGGPRGVNPQTVAAAERQGIELTRPDVDPTRRNMYGFLESLPLSGGRVRADLQRGANQIEERLADVGGVAGAVPRPTAGDNLRAAGERYVDRSRTVVDRMYDRADTLSGNAQITPTQALATIDRNIAELSETPSVNAAKLDLMNRLRSDLVDDTGLPRALSVGAIRDLRTNMREVLSANGLRYSDTERRIMGAIDSANGDIASQLDGAALRAFQRADRSYRERADLVDNVVERFIGNSRVNPRSGEQVMSAVENAARPRSGDAASLARLMDRLQPAERQEVAATIASQLGRRGIEGDAAFSPSLFFSQVRDYSPEARAAIFGRQGAADLADLARVSEARAGTLSRLNNSRSGQVVNWMTTLQGLLTTGGGAGAVVGGLTGFGAAAGGGAGAAGAGAIAVGGYVTARMMGNRRVVSALAQAARAQNPQSRGQAVRYLSAIAVREPQLSSEILPVRDALQSALDEADQPQRARVSAQ